MSTLVFPSTVTQANAAACAALLRQGVQTAAPEPVVIDASALQRFDSAALSVLLDVRREALAAGRATQLVDAPAALLSLAHAYGLGELLT